MDANVQHLMTQLRQNPLDFALLGELRQHCEATQSFALWAEALEYHARAATDAEGDPVELGRLHFELGNLYQNQLGRADLALDHYRTAIEFDAAQRPALAAARSIASEAGNWEEVSELLSREADSLPAGPKRASTLVELASVQRGRLDQREEAENTLREAARYTPDDLQLQHELATLLLDNADHSGDAGVAAAKRRDAAEALARMARAVSDDYALAYIEAALDAVPDHAPSLELLDVVAPRMGRADALAPRWLHAIRFTDQPALARSLRLKMASAYLAVGQLNDVRVCLDPLLAQGDPEALALARRAARSEPPSGGPSDTMSGKHSSRPARPHEQELASSEMVLEGDEDEQSAHGEDQHHRLADELEGGDFANGARDPLADLALLDRASRPGRRVDASHARRDDDGQQDDEHGDYEEQDEHGEHDDDDEQGEHADDEELTDDMTESREELLDSGELSTVGDSSERTLADELEEPEEAPQAGRQTPRPSQRAGSGARGFDKIDFHSAREDDELDPFAEDTQPRAAPLTLAELTALTNNHGDRPSAHVAVAPAGELPTHDPDSEAGLLTPAEDPEAAALRSLRGELAKRLRFRDRRGAAEVAQTLLDRGVFDSQAIEALEEHFRLARDFKGLRDLSLRLAGELSFSSDVRSARLREAVMLSESKLGDHDGAALALRTLLSLEPNDAEAFDKLKKLLRRSQRWDELASLLTQRVDELPEPKARAELLRELGALHREKRAAVEPAIAAYARARELDGGQADDEAALSELYQKSGRFAEAAKMFEARIARLEPSQRPPLLATLAQLYEDKLHDDALAQRALESWRAIEPRKPEALQALVRVLERQGDFAALADALAEQLTLASPTERVGLHVRIAEVALAKLRDPARAADSYGEAIALSPASQSLWHAAVPAFEQAQRTEELDSLLWGIAHSGRDRGLSSMLFEHLAHVRTARGDLAGAILAREAQLAVTQDVSVLDAVVALLRRAERPADLARRLDELARRSEPETARALRLERADVFAQKLADPEAAKAELERLLSELGADDANALRKLVELCAATGDTKRRASAQERLVKLAPSLPARVELAVELVDIYEHELNDTTGATRVLGVWTTLEPENPTPYVRLAPLLAQAGRKRELLDTLDKLATLANSEEETGEFILRAARVAIEIEDYDGGWARLVPRVVDAEDAAAERMLRELARTAGRGEQLAALYVGLAQRSNDEQVERRRWADAARVFEQELSAYDRALEAMLRALAKQLDNRELLGEVERLAGRAHAWQRLSQVYDTIVRKAESTEIRIQLLLRHARLLETRAGDPPAAFERVWLAYQLDPSIDETYGEARRLAIATGRGEELLGTYERRALSNASREARVDALLEACALAQHDLEDTARATGYLSRAVALAGDIAAQLDIIEARVRALDAAHPPVDGRGLQAELTGVYAQLAHENPRTPLVAAIWLARAARIHELKLDDPDAAFRALERASALAPSDEALLDELSRVAALGRNWEGLAKHLQHAAEVAIDSNSSSAALSRLGLLCERELRSPSRAADAYEQLVRLRPKDADASRRLRQCLRASDRFDELLIAIDRELFMLKPEDGKRELLKQAAETWEFGLKNRYEALDAWKKVSALAPADPDAVAALARLRSRPRADDSLLDEDVVVLPEDLRPSLVGAVPAASTLFSSEHAAPDGSANGRDFMRHTHSSVPASARAERRASSPARVADLDGPADDWEAFERQIEGAEAANTRFDAEPIEPSPTRPTAHGDAHAGEPLDAAREHAAEHDAVQDAEDEDEEWPLPENLELREPALAEADHGALGELDSDLDGALSEELSTLSALELFDDEGLQDGAEASHGEIDLAEALGDYDADVTLPLDRDERRRAGRRDVSLEGLNTIATRPPPPPPSVRPGAQPGGSTPPALPRAVPSDDD